MRMEADVADADFSIPWLKAQGAIE
jgi:hypothetical protein